MAQAQPKVEGFWEAQLSDVEQHELQRVCVVLRHGSSEDVEILKRALKAIHANTCRKF
jgi:predicted secreted Zn-dependent protease